MRVNAGPASTFTRVTTVPARPGAVSVSAASDRPPSEGAQMSTATTARTAARVAIGLLVGAGVAISGASSAAADDDPGPTSPSPSSTQYPPPEEPTLTADVLQPVCDGDVPYLAYAVTATGTDSDTVTITWLNPAGDDVVLSDLPLSGRILWPGAVTNADGDAVDWPGWRLVDGQWVEGDEYDWVRPSVDVLFHVNPEMTATVAYPPSSPSCATSPPGTPPASPGGDATSEPGETVAAPVPGEAAPPPGSSAGSAPSGAAFLPQTGAEVAALVAVAGGLVVVGGVALAAARRRRSAAR